MTSFKEVLSKVVTLISFLLSFHVTPNFVTTINCFFTFKTKLGHLSHHIFAFVMWNVFIKAGKVLNYH